MEHLVHQAEAAAVAAAAAAAEAAAEAAVTQVSQQCFSIDVSSQEMTGFIVSGCLFL